MLLLLLLMQHDRGLGLGHEADLFSFTCMQAGLFVTASRFPDAEVHAFDERAQQLPTGPPTLEHLLVLPLSQEQLVDDMLREECGHPPVEDDARALATQTAKDTEAMGKWYTLYNVSTPSRVIGEEVWGVV